MHRNLDELTRAGAIDAIARYCRQVLEWPNPAFGNKPACPFSRRERESDKVQYEFFAIESGGPSDDMIEVAREFVASGRCTTLLFVDPIKSLTVAQAAEYGIELSRRCRAEQLVAIGVHPDDDYAIDGFQPRCGVPYVMMLCQTAAYLRAAKQQLEGTGYYDKWPLAALEYNYRQIGQFL